MHIVGLYAGTVIVFYVWKQNYSTGKLSLHRVHFHIQMLYCTLHTSVGYLWGNTSRYIPSDELQNGRRKYESLWMEWGETEILQDKTSSA